MQTLNVDTSAAAALVKADWHEDRGEEAVAAHWRRTGSIQSAAERLYGTHNAGVRPSWPARMRRKGEDFDAGGVRLKLVMVFCREQVELQVYREDAQGTYRSPSGTRYAHSATTVVRRTTIRTHGAEPAFRAAALRLAKAGA